MSSLRTDEVGRFNRLASTWWDTHGPMRPLHVINDLRLAYVLDQIAAHVGRPAGALQGLRVLDVGCGGGLMCEPLAARGAQVVGVDAASNNITAARLHAGVGGLQIDYRLGEPQQALRADESFDVLLLLEVVEHVDDMPRFVQDAAAHLAPGGLLVASTINRTVWSYCAAIVGAERIFRILPPGTHRWQQLVRPGELEAAAVASGLVPRERRGMAYLPLIDRAWWTRSLAANYIASFTRPQVRAS